MRRRTKPDFCFTLFYLSKRFNVAVLYFQEQVCANQNRDKEIIMLKAIIHPSGIAKTSVKKRENSRHLQ